MSGARALIAIGISICAPRAALAQEPAAPPVPMPAEAPAALPPPPAAGPPPPEVTFGAVPLPAPPARPAWRPRDAHVAISLEHLIEFEAVAVETDHNGDGMGSYGDSTRTRSTFPFTGDSGGPPRLAVDVLFGGTVGAFFGFGRRTDHLTSHDPVLGDSDAGEHTVSYGLVGVRGGVILGHGETVALWLRGGVGFSWSGETPAEDGATTTAVLVALDPVIVVAPMRHVAFTFGPYVEWSRGSFKHKTMGVVDPGDHTWMDFLLSATTNFSVMF